MSQYDPTALTLDYAERAAETRRTVANSAWAAANGLQVGSIAPGQSDEVYLQIVEELPEAALDQAGRLLYQRREDANDLLYVGIIDDAGDPRWVLLSELQETGTEIGIWKWTVYDNTLDSCYGVTSTGTELLVAEVSGLTTAAIRRRNLTTGASIGTFGSYGSGSGQFQAPRGLAVSSAGNIHVADAQLDRVVQFNSSRTFVRNIGSSGTGNGNLSGPRGVCCDSSNNVYVADYANKRVAVFNSTGTWQRNIGSAGVGDGEFQGPAGVFVTSGGELYVTDLVLNNVQVFTASTGAYLRKFGTFGAGEGQFYQPTDVQVDADGDVYVADQTNGRVQKLTSNGTYLMQFGGRSSTGLNVIQGLYVNGADVYANAALNNARYTPATKLFTVIPRAGVEVAANGSATISARGRLNLVAGTGVAVTVADDSTNGEADITLDAFPMRVVLFQLGTIFGTDAQWSNMPSAETMLFGFGNGDFPVPVDLTRATEARVILRANSAASGANIRIKYTTTGTGTSMSYAALAASGNVSANLPTVTGSTNVVVGSWTAIAAGAKVDPCYIAPFGASGNGTNDPFILFVAVEFR